MEFFIYPVFAVQLANLSQPLYYQRIRYCWQYLPAVCKIIAAVNSPAEIFMEFYGLSSKMAAVGTAGATVRIARPESLAALADGQTLATYTGGFSVQDLMANYSGWVDLPSPPA